MDGAENTTQKTALPPLEVTDYSLEGWPNSNKKPLCEVSTTEEDASQDSDIATPMAAPRTPSIHRDPSGSHTLTNSAVRNPFLADTHNQEKHLRHQTNRTETYQPKWNITHCGMSSERLRQET